MSDKKSLVEDTFLQIKDLENVIAENAKGILASTMKQEINSLVKESLKEQDEEEEIEDDLEMDDMDMDGDDEMDDMDMDDEPIDLTAASDEEILRVFKSMSDEDGIIVKKEGDKISLSDENEDAEYLIQLGESEEEDLVEFDDDEFDMEDDDEFEMDMEDDSEMENDEKPKTIEDLSKIYPDVYEWKAKVDAIRLGELNEEDEDDDELIYELEIEDEDEDEYAKIDAIFNEEFEDEDEFQEIDLDDEETIAEGKFKAKGVGMGNASKFKYDKKPNQGKGFNVKKSQGTRGVGMGKPKFEYKDGENLDMKMKKVETKESSRTLSAGKKFGRKGLDKPKAAPRHLKTESVEAELKLLREKNEEYRKALNIFRDKINEVAVFNSNLAYATRLFTEHSTTKQEKINILQRFDSVDTIKESKNLYKTIKEELSPNIKGDSNITESLNKNVNKRPTSGSAVSLIESKTYENPQFLRMKDLMSKL